ncbi:Pepco domain-containing protein [Streptomyces sp. enrichment culture]|uniref:Pepco domain-containing protein n=1 Tax=Streptomyces sp. enrichment culture TaxID=1795815 RepID=UPI003F55313D
MESYTGDVVEELEFLVADGGPGDTRDKSFARGGGEDGTRVRRQAFKPADLNAQLTRTLNGLRVAFDGLQQAGPEGWGISEVQVSCQLTASGQLVVLGVGGQAQRTGAIQLTLTPRPAGGDR